MKFPWRSRRGEQTGSPVAAGGASYESEIWIPSGTVPGVRFRLARISFSRRLDLMRRLRELARHAEFLSAGETTAEQMDAVLIQAEIEQLCVSWGVKAIEGLTIDGMEASPERIAAGPEPLFREILAAVRQELGLTAEERKN